MQTMTTDDDTGQQAGTTDGRIEQPSVDDLAAVGARLGDDGTAWKAALRAFASYGISAGHKPRDSAVLEAVAGQVYATLDDPDPAATGTVRTFTERFAAVYGLDDADAVSRLLGREPHEKQAYEGRLAFQGDA
jgi:hypothetical protein